MTTLKRQEGFSLVELMVAVVIGLIGTVIMFQAYSAFEAQRRVTTSGGDTTANLTIAANIIEQAGKQAGYGMNLTTHLGCSMYFWYQPSQIVPPATAPVAGQAKAYRMVPVDIATGGNSFTFYRSGGDLTYSSPTLEVDMADPSSDLKVNAVKAFGFNVGDVVVAAERQTSTPGSITCAGFEITEIEDEVTKNASYRKLKHDKFGAYTSGSATYYTRFNKEDVSPNKGLGSWPVPAPTGLSTLLPAITTPATQFAFKANTTYLINLGRARPIEAFFGATTFSLSSDGRLLSNGVPIADNIVFLRAQYGKAASDAKNAAVTYTSSMPDPATNQAEWLKLRSVRVALVARVGQYEKDEVKDSTGTVKTAITYWTDQSFTIPDTRYRYRLLELEIPLRNFFWRP